MQIPMGLIYLALALSGAAFVTGQGCGGNYNSSNGIIRHPLSGSTYKNNENCTWIIRTEDRIKISFVSLDIGWGDTFFLRDGDSIESNVIHKFYGDIIPNSVHTSTNAAHLLFKSDNNVNSTGFELHWEPLVKTFYRVLLHSDYEVRISFSINPKPTHLQWSYGANFQEMPNLIQIPSDNGKFSTSLIDHENGNYAALLKIAGITEEDFETKFKLRVSNEIGETYYRVKLSAFSNPPSSVKFSDIMPTSVRIMWYYDTRPGNVSNYVIHYKPMNTSQNYTEISDLFKKFYTVKGLMPSTKYEFHVLSVEKIGHGPPSDTTYVTTNEIGCGGEYNSDSGVIIHPTSGGKYKNKEKCTWIIRATDPINITLVSLHTDMGYDYLTIRDGDSIDSDVLQKVSGHHYYRSSVQTNTNAAHLLFTSDIAFTGMGFELHWEPIAMIMSLPAPFPRPPSSFEISDITSTSVRITWNYNINPGNISSYVIQYKPRNSTQDYKEISGIVTMFYTVSGLTSSTEYEFHVLAVNNIGNGPPSEPSYVTTSEIGVAYPPAPAPAPAPAPTPGPAPAPAPAPAPPAINTGCGDSYSSSTGMIQHPLSGGKYQDNERCTWIIRAEDRIKITFVTFNTETSYDFLTIRDGESIESNELGKFSGNTFSGANVPRSVQTSKNTAHLLFTSDYDTTRTGFELHWDPLGCGGEYNSSSGTIRHPLSGRNYQDNERCTWIIRAEDRIKITFVTFDTYNSADSLTIRDGKSIESSVLGKFHGSRFSGANVPRSVQTSTNAAHLFFTSSSFFTGTGFELHWEPLEFYSGN